MECAMITFMIMWCVNKKRDEVDRADFMCSCVRDPTSLVFAALLLAIDIDEAGYYTSQVARTRGHYFLGTPDCTCTIN